MRIGIQGHPNRGEDVQNILKMLINNPVEYNCDNPRIWYEIHGKFIIPMELKSPDYKYYTLEEFEKEFPFKIGDIVQTVPHGQPGIITELCSDPIYILVYKIRYNSKRELLFPSQILKLYTPMQKERNITLTLDKAKEWYKQGGDLKEVALQAFTKEELNPLPKSWEEYCKIYIVPTMLFGSNTPLKYIALWKLEKLRDCYRQGWKPDWTNGFTDKYCIVTSSNRRLISPRTTMNVFLSFQSKEIAEEFLKNFDPLIKGVGDLI